MKQRDTILIVDDMEVNRVILAELFTNDYVVMQADNGIMALELLKEYEDRIAVILLDIVMPGKDGYEVTKELADAGILDKIPVIIVTSEDSPDIEMKVFDIGVADMIMKPFEPHVVKRRVLNIVELYQHKNHLEELVEEQAKTLQESNEAMIDALSSVIEYRNMESGQHVRRIRMFTKILCENVAAAFPAYHLDERKINMIASASSMHDIGKIVIPDSILNKPGRLTKEEFEIMKTHSEQGSEILKNIVWMKDQEFLQYAYSICRYHHERWDGKGYPDGLKGDNIPIYAQIVGIADVYDALTTDRVYKEAYSHEKATTMILNGECGVFSPRLLECFKNVNGQFEELKNRYTDGYTPLDDSFFKKTAVSMRDSANLNMLQFGELKYFTILNFLNATVLEVDLDSGIFHMIHSNSPYFQALQTDLLFDEVRRIFIYSRIHPEEQDELVSFDSKQMCNALNQGEDKIDLEFRLMTEEPDTYRWYRSSLLKVHTDNPKEHKVLIVFEDIHEKKIQQKNAYECNLFSALRSVFSAVHIVDLTNNTIQAIKDELLEFQKEINFVVYSETIRGLAEQVIHPDDKRRFLMELDKICLSKYFNQYQSKVMEYRCIGKDDTYHWMQIVCILDETAELKRENIQRIYVFVRSVEDKKQQELQMNMAETQLNAVIDVFTDIAAEINIDENNCVFLKSALDKAVIPLVGDKKKFLDSTGDFIHPEDLKILEDLTYSSYLRNAFMAGVKRIPVEFRLSGNKNDWKWYRGLFINEDNGGNHMLFVANKAPQKMDEVICEQSELPVDLSRLLKTAPGGIAEIAYDDELTVLAATSGFFQILGYEKDDFYKYPIQGKFLRTLDVNEQNFQIHSMREVLRKNDLTRIEFQAIRQDGADVWLEAIVKPFQKKDNSVILQCVFSDITDVHKISIDLASNETSYLDMLQHFNDILFEFDLITGEIKFTNNFSSKFGVEAPTNFDELVEIVNFKIHEDDIEDYINTLSKLKFMHPDRNTLETEYRFKSSDNHILWCRERIYILRDEEKHPYKAIGIISDIDKYKMENEILEFMANTDLLTGLYNKTVTEQMINDVLLEKNMGQIHALFVIDVDDFKTVNDTVGHLMGDTILRRVANTIAAQFRKNDIVGRVGGDEFVVFIKNVGNPENVKGKAISLLQSIQKISISEETKRTISVSIGIGMYPEHGENFNDLFKSADTALYSVKRTGKGQWRIFSKKISKISADRKSFIHYDLLEQPEPRKQNTILNQVFQIYLHTQDGEKTIRELLDLIARECDLNHIYIWETGRGIRKIFEWNAKTAANYIVYADNSKNTFRDIFQQIYQSKQEYICNDVKAASEVEKNWFSQMEFSSVLQVPILNDDKQYGVVGFSESNGERIWKQQEIEACYLISRMFSLIYMNTDLLHQMSQANEISKYIFEKIDVAGYVVDEGYEVQMVSLKLKTMAAIYPGQKCYSVLCNNSRPCVNCPIKKLGRSKDKVVSEIYVDALHNKYTVTAASIHWFDNRTAYIITIQ